MVVTRRDFMVGCPFSAAAVLSCTVQADRWTCPSSCCSGLFLTMTAGLVVSLSRFDFLLSGLLPGCLLLIRVGGSKSVEVWRVWEIYDDRLQFMSRQDALLLSESLDIGDVSQAWLVWSRAAETALADAYCFSGGPAPCQGLVLGRGMARFRRVRLGGYKVRKVRCNAVDVHDAA